MESLFTGNLYQIRLMGNLKGILKSDNLESAMRRGAFVYNNGNTSGVSVREISFTHKDWKQYKAERSLRNKDIAHLIGSTEDSVKSMTQPNKELPKWAITMLYEWQLNK